MEDRLSKKCARYPVVFSLGNQISFTDDRSDKELHQLSCSVFDRGLAEASPFGEGCAIIVVCECYLSRHAPAAIGE